MNNTKDNRQSTQKENNFSRKIIIGFFAGSIILVITTYYQKRKKEKRERQRYLANELQQTLNNTTFKIRHTQRFNTPITVLNISSRHNRKIHIDIKGMFNKILYNAMINSKTKFYGVIKYELFNQYDGTSIIKLNNEVVSREIRIDFYKEIILLSYIAFAPFNINASIKVYMTEFSQKLPRELRKTVLDKAFAEQPALIQFISKDFYFKQLNSKQQELFWNGFFRQSILKREGKKIPKDLENIIKNFVIGKG